MTWAATRGRLGRRGSEWARSRARARVEDCASCSRNDAARLAGSRSRLDECDGGMQRGGGGERERERGGNQRRVVDQTTKIQQQNNNNNINVSQSSVSIAMTSTTVFSGHKQRERENNPKRQKEKSRQDTLPHQLVTLSLFLTHTDKTDVTRTPSCRARLFEFRRHPRRRRLGRP